MKKIFLTILIVCLILMLFSACNSSKKGASDESEHEHNYSAATCTQPRTCECGLTKGRALGHDFEDATCTNPQTCERCATTLGSPTGHSYSNNVCIHCKQVDLDSLPVSLGKLHIIDGCHSYCEWNDGTLVDSFGDRYAGYFSYRNVDLGTGAKSIHNLNKEYSTFSGGIVCQQNTDRDSYMIVYIYVDGILKYTSPTFDKTTGKIDFSVDVSGGQKLTIHSVTVEKRTSYSSHLALVETKLTKE